MKTLTNQHSGAVQVNSVQIVGKKNGPRDLMAAELLKILKEMGIAAWHAGCERSDFDRELRELGTAPVYTSYLDALDSKMPAFIRNALKADSARATGEPTVIEKIRAEVGHYFAPLLFPPPSPQK